MSLPQKRGPGIEFADLSLSYGSSRILDKLNFRVEPGSIHCLIGPNGGGKTSTVRSLLGETPHQGRITLEWSSAERVIGYVPQKLSFDYTLPINVDDLLAILTGNRPAFLRQNKRNRAVFSKVLERGGMLEKRSRLMGELSGGERQRVLLAQALIPQPQLLILDEPTAGLDQEGSAVFESIIEDMSNMGTTIIWIHHDLREVKRKADAVTCINRSVIFSGIPEKLLTKERILDVFASSAVVAGESND